MGETITRKEAGEMAADWIFRFMEELGSEPIDCLNAAKDIYLYITGKDDLNVEEVIGFSEEEIEEIPEGGLFIVK